VSQKQNGEKTQSMFSRKELAAAQRNSHIFEQNDPAIITSPNYKRTDRTTAYRHALQQQILDDEESKRQERMTADDHPLEMKVNRYSLKNKAADDETDDDQTFQIGTQENRSMEDRRSAQAKYRAQLESDSHRFKEMTHSDDPLVGRKPYARRPISPSDSWNIGKDEAVTKLQKKKEANEFYRQEMIAHPPSGAANKTRHRTAAATEDGNSDGVGFNIGRDELELRALKALQRQEYRDALDEQKVIDEARRSSQLKKERNEERALANSKLPYSQR
jgi:hypothetical protein